MNFANLYRKVIVAVVVADTFAVAANMAAACAYRLAVRTCDASLAANIVDAANCPTVATVDSLFRRHFGLAPISVVYRRADRVEVPVDNDK